MDNEHKLLEPEIKAMTLDHLKIKGIIDKTTTVINEFTIDQYSRRVDLVLANNRHLTAIEVKSEADSLDRLEGQVNTYLDYFDKVIVVAAPKHVDKILKTTPDQVGVWQVSNKLITIKRRGKTVPIKREANLIALMKANELVKLSNSLGLSRTSQSRHSAENALKLAPTRVLKDASIQYIKKRFSSTSSRFWEQAENRAISPKHIELLSPYKEQRAQIKREQEKRNSFWNTLSKSLEENLDHLSAA